MRVMTSVLGHFGEGVNLLNGQTVKTKIITDELISQLGDNQVIKYDTHGGKKMLVKAPFQVLSALKKSKNVLIFPAQNGLRVYAPLLAILRCLFRNRKLHYIVIGGWLPRFICKRRMLFTVLKCFDGIYVETNTMKLTLNAQGLTNVYVMPNCKNLKILSNEELIYPSNEPYKLCTFSRVMKEKGIEDIVNSIVTVNDDLGYQAFSLDIYGQVDATQIEWFDTLKHQFPNYICYCGCVESDKSVEVLKSYFAMVFPTLFFTEGIPGTIIDAYAAGIPVISAKWESFSDVVDDGITGIGYDFGNKTQLENILRRIVKNPNVMIDMKENCIKKAKDYIPSITIKNMIEKNF